MSLRSLIANVSSRLTTPRGAAWTLLVLTLLGVALRVVATYSYNSSHPDDPSRLVGDETGYHGLAVGVLDGYFFDWPGRVPVYPLFIAGVYWIVGQSPAKLLYAQALLGGGTIVLSWLLARRFVSPLAALLVALFVAIHFGLIDHCTRLYTEALYTPLLLLSLWLMLRALDEFKAGRFLAAGVAMALLALTRPTGALLPVLLLFFLPTTWSRSQRVAALAVYALGMAMLIAPWTLHNLRTHHRFLPLSVSTAILWQGSPEFYHLMENKRRLMDIWANEMNPQVNGGQDPFTIDGDRYFTRRAVASIVAEPVIYLEYCYYKLAYLWFGHPASEWPYWSLYDWSTLRQFDYSTWRIVGMFATRQIPLIALAAVIWMFRQRQLAGVAYLLAVCGYFIIIHTITYPETRYSEPLHPLLAIIIAAVFWPIRSRFIDKPAIENPQLESDHTLRRFA